MQWLAKQWYPAMMLHNGREAKVKVTQSGLTLWDPMDYTVHGIIQARILEWVLVRFFRGSSQPRNGTSVSCIVGGFFTSWASRKANNWKGSINLVESDPSLRVPKWALYKSQEQIYNGEIKLTVQVNDLMPQLRGKSVQIWQMNSIAEIWKYLFQRGLAISLQGVSLCCTDAKAETPILWPPDAKN